VPKIRPVFRTWVAALCLALAPSSPLVASDFTVELTEENDDLLEEIERSSLSRASLDREDATGTDVVAAAKADYRRILEVLYANGFFDSEISILVNGREAANLSPFAEFATLPSIAVSVSPGPPFVFGRTAIAPVAADTALPDEFTPGERARSSTIRQAVDAGVRGWRDTGHPRAALAGQDLRARHRDAELDVALSLEPGPQLRFGTLEISGTERMDTRRVAKIAALPTGEVFSPKALQDAQRRLVDTGVFRSVVVREKEQNNPDGTIDVTAELQEEKLRRIGGGVEYGSTEGLALSAYWFHRNLLGGGERLRFDAELSQQIEGSEELEYSLGFLFRRPATPRALTDLVLSAVISREENDDFREDQITAEMLFDRQFTDALSVASGLRFTATETDFKPGIRNFVTLGTPVRLTYDVRDFETNAKSGYYLETEVFPFYGMEDAESGVRFALDSRYYLSFGEDERLTLALRGQLGAIFGAESGEVPESFLFLSGGSGTVRGQPYESLGITTPNGTFGGTEFAAATFEMRYELFSNFGVVGFFDIGYVGDGNQDGTHSGAGLGVRYNTPIGPLRLDLAGPVDGDTSDGVQFYFGIGQAF
jgi:translocation and assembly module TamA